eukprot:g6887.t1
MGGTGAPLEARRAGGTGAAAPVPQATEVVDLASIQSFGTSEDTAVCYHLLLGARSRRGIGLAIEASESEGTEHVAQRAFVSLLALQDPKPVGATLEKLGQAEKAKAGNEQVKLKPEWQEQRILWSPDGFFCWLCQAGPSPEANMQQHVESAQHQRKLVLAGLKEDHKILPPVPKDYEERAKQDLFPRWRV